MVTLLKKSQVIKSIINKALKFKISYLRKNGKLLGTPGVP